MSLVAGYRGRYMVIPPSKEEVDEWESTLKNMQTRILNSLLTRVPDQNAFNAKIVEPAVTAWSNFVNPNWENVDFVKLKYQLKLKVAYPAWNKGVNEAFKEGGYFGDRVSGKKIKWLKARYVLGSTGLRYKLGRGIAVKAIGVISGMYRVLSDIRSSDETVNITTYNEETGAEETVSVTIPHDDFEGSVVNVFLPGAARFVRPQAVALITQGLVYAGLADSFGMASERDSILNTINTYLANTVLKQVDTAAYDVKMGLKYLAGEGKIVVCVDVYNAGERPSDPSNWFCSELS